MDEIFDDPTLSDPDAESDARYAWDEEFQRHVIAMIVADRQFILQSIDLVKPSYFTHKAHQKTCSIVFKFFREYRLLPKKAFIVQEIKSSLKDDKSLDYHLGELNVLYDYFQPGLDARDYLMDKITYFAKMQAFRKAFHDGLKLLDDNPESEENWQKIYDGIETVVTTTSNFDLGMNYFKSHRDRYAQMLEDDQNNERFVSGVESIDIEATYTRGEIISIVAGSGVGKSVMLACITATNLLRGKKGVYITLEIPASEVAKRMDSILTGFPVQCLYSNKDEIWEILENLNEGKPGVPTGQSGVDYECGMPLVIKQFPAASASVNTLRAYLSQLRFHKFDPDFVIVDYIGEMQDIPGMKKYESMERIVRELRGMATEEDIFVATAMQPNRGSKEDAKSDKGRIDDQHLADSFGQIRPLDGCFSLNQNDVEKYLGLGRGYVIKQRNGKSRYQFYLRFDKENLRITEIDKQTYMEARNAHKEEVVQEVEIDAVTSRRDEGKDAWEEAIIDNTKAVWKPSDDEDDTSEE